MAEQINVRLSEDLLAKAREYSKIKGFGNLQNLIREVLREKIYEDDAQDAAIALKILKHSEKHNLFVDEKEFMRVLDEK